MFSAFFVENRKRFAISGYFFGINSNVAALFSGNSPGDVGADVAMAEERNAQAVATAA